MELPLGSNGEKKLQEAFSTREKALDFYNKQMLTYLAPLMQSFIDNQEMMFIATSDAKGECDSSFRAGEKGFVYVLDDKHLLYPEYLGNGVMASLGNISENPQIGLMFLDFFETKVGLHVNGKAKILTKDILKSSLDKFEGVYEKVQDTSTQFKKMAYVLVEVEEAYIHCSLHIPILEKVKDKAVLDTYPNGSKGGDYFELLEYKVN
ncbi:MAG: pyridoxamine 5'-phosphate oxidase family protein [Sulfurovum sp.]|nr:pyridoxamine 5'-phosphate oxidase family protein [Sulfurovum sp.]